MDDIFGSWVCCVQCFDAFVVDLHRFCQARNESTFAQNGFAHRSDRRNVGWALVAVLENEVVNLILEVLKGLLAPNYTNLRELLVKIRVIRGKMN
ncbi:MAG: hypothetical protein RLZZ628_193 [Bacteroidota bacterium]|jgi:hypothetical protein